MYQGDQYNIPFTIKTGNTTVTPETCDGVKIEVANITKEYPGEITFDAEGGKWLYPVTQEESLAIKGKYKIQVQVNFGGTPPVIVSSEVVTEQIGRSVILEEWDG